MLRQFLSEYSTWLQGSGRAAATVVAYHKDVEQFVEFMLRGGKTHPNQVVVEDIEHYQQELQTLRYTNKSVARKLNAMRSFFNYLIEKSILASNPMQQIRHPKYDVVPPRVLKVLEYRALRDTCKADQRMSAIIELLLQTGLRISEVASLRVEDISLTKKTLLIPSMNSHGSRQVPLNNRAAQAIQAYQKIRPRAKEPTFFLTKSCRPFLVRNIRSAIDRYFKLSGIEHAKVNDLRHTFIVQQLAAGVPLVQVSQIVGHKRLSTTERYLQFLDKDQQSPNITIQEL
jgi:site-specific recombinase XerD